MYKAKAIVVILFAFSVAIACGLPTRDDLCSDPNHGVTTLSGRVMDFYTHQLIDSVRIRVVSGISWDRYLDTTVVQRDSILFTFNTPDDCEDYFFTLYNSYYLTDIEADSMHYYNMSVDKGTLNKFEVNLKPATVIELIVTRDTLSQYADTVLLDLKRKDGQWGRWGDISADDFRKHSPLDMMPDYVFHDSASYRTISIHYSIEGNTNYDVRWVRQSTTPLDSLLGHFSAKPFDTVQLHYRFERMKR